MDVVVPFPVGRAETTQGKTTIPKMPLCYGGRGGPNQPAEPRPPRVGPLASASVNTPGACHGAGGGGGGRAGRCLGQPPGPALPFLNWSGSP